MKLKDPSYYVTTSCKMLVEHSIHLNDPKPYQAVQLEKMSFLDTDHAVATKDIVKLFQPTWQLVIYYVAYLRDKNANVVMAATGSYEQEAKRMLFQIIPNNYIVYDRNQDSDRNSTK